jgi:hypothetical protein
VRAASAKAAEAAELRLQDRQDGFEGRHRWDDDLAGAGLTGRASD